MAAPDPLYVTNRFLRNMKTALCKDFTVPNEQKSERHQYANYMDAVCIASKFGAADLFQTLTSNPRWPVVVSWANARGIESHESMHMSDVLVRAYLGSRVTPICMEPVGLWTGFGVCRSPRIHKYLVNISRTKSRVTGLAMSRETLTVHPLQRQIWTKILKHELWVSIPRKLAKMVVSLFLLWALPTRVCTLCGLPLVWFCSSSLV